MKKQKFEAKVPNILVVAIVAILAIVVITIVAGKVVGKATLSELLTPSSQLQVSTATLLFKSLGQSCTSNTPCYSGNCQAGVCARGSKVYNQACVFSNREDECTLDTNGNPLVCMRLGGSLLDANLLKCRVKFSPNTPCAADVQCGTNDCRDLGTGWGPKCRISDVGFSCATNVDCVSLLCNIDKKCLQGAVPNGGSCTDSQQCTSTFRYCVNGVCNGFRLANGQGCTDNSQCTSTICNQNVCSSVVLAGGAKCQTNNQCASGSCIKECNLAGTCRDDGFCRKRLSESCASTSECVSGLTCAYGQCRYPLGHECSVSSQCASDKCCRRVTRSGPISTGIVGTCDVQTATGCIL